MAKLSVKKDDYVMIIAGKDKGKTAKVLAIDTKKNRAVIEGKGITTIKKAVKARKASDRSGIIEMPATIDISNIMPICGACDKPTRVGFAVIDGKKQRVCKKCGAVLETKKAADKKAKATVKKRSKKAATAETAEDTKQVNDGAEKARVMEAMDTVKEEPAKVLVKEEAGKAEKDAAAKESAPKATATARKRVKKDEQADGAEEVRVMEAMDTVKEETAKVVVKSEDKIEDKE